MNSEELKYRLMLLQVRLVGPMLYKKLIQEVGSARDVFHQSKHALKKITGIGDVIVNEIKAPQDEERIEKEIAFIEKNNIQVIHFTQQDYPVKLLQCIDSPPILFFKGKGHLNFERSISIIGTRNNTDYGKLQTEKIIQELKNYNVQIISGLAYGIDIIAHKAALKNEMSTVGVVAHGLDTIYPSIHQSVATDMQVQGGIVSEYFSQTNPDRENFPTRNRIVAGLTDATIIIETDIKGGSMITAELAYGYNKDVYSVPGRLIDKYSSGCNKLIADLKANIYTDIDEFAKQLGWVKPAIEKPKQKKLFIELTPHEEKIVQLLQQKNQVHIDELLLQTQLKSSEIANALLQLELKDIIRAQPGKTYSIA